MPDPDIMKIYKEALTLPDYDKLTLISNLAASMQSKEKKHQRNLLELEGLGKEIWSNIDVNKYIDNLRSEWDE